MRREAAGLARGGGRHLGPLHHDDVDAAAEKEPRDTGPDHAGADHNAHGLCPDDPSCIERTVEEFGAGVARRRRVVDIGRLAQPEPAPCVAVYTA